ncbi:MAG: NADPH-dependent glutamate synthase [Dehalococcoidaceae bacterium]|nr:NADPH-dependent glutamate synthase [Dehalococcoidaceae bacterium]
MKERPVSRTAIPRQSARQRRHNFDEVALGYTAQMAVAEATRCLQCKKAKCIDGCPVGIDIPGFIKAITEENFAAAVNILKSDNVLPGICGRVCPQETQCEQLCILDKKGESVAIGRLERFVADWERMQNSPVFAVPGAAPSGKKVAVVGAGPAGLTAAADLARMGHGVTVFESLHTPGGVLKYGIPDFRLPSAIVDEEVNNVKNLGVDIELNTVIGKTETVDELLGRFDAVFLGTGAGLPLFMHIPGENLSGVYSANEFLTRVNLMHAYQFPTYHTPVKTGKRVAVIGGGNVAMDAARAALRLGADKVYVIYRRSEAEMPARREEVENAVEEGIEFVFLANPIRFLGDEKRNLTGVECIRMKLGEPDSSGRRRPVPQDGSQFQMELDVAIVALGTTPNPLISRSTPGLEVNRWGTLVCDETTGRTTRPGVWAGGDVVTGSATVISAMGAARKAARDIDDYLKGSAGPDQVWRENQAGNDRNH